MVIPLSTPATEGAPSVPYPATLDVPHELVEHVAWLLYEHRQARNTRRRKLGCFNQALLTLVHLRKDETFSQLGAGFGISQATAWRYVDEPYYSMKHRKHGTNAQGIARPDGTPLWFSRATPGRTHDLTAARAHGIVQACLTRQTLVLADRAYQGAGATFRTPYYHHREHPALPAVQPRPRPTESPRLTRLRAVGILAAAPTSQMLHTPHRHHHPSRSHTADLQLFRMKKVQ